ncbi:hypothetical protein Tco_1247160 [Tanacetum coccineum]
MRVAAEVGGVRACFPGHHHANMNVRLQCTSSVPSKNTQAVIQEYVPIMGVPSKNTRAVIQEYVPIMGVPSKNTRAVLQEYVPIMGVPSKNTRAVLQ